MGAWTLPEGWELLSVSRLAEDTPRRNPRNDPDVSFRYVDIASVDNENLCIAPERVKQILGKDAPSRARKVIHANDIIFATTRPYLKNIALVPSELDGEICSTGFCVLHPIIDRLEPRYLYYAIRTDLFIKQLLPKQRGASYPAVVDNDVFESLVPIPYPGDAARSLAEQQRIVARLEALLGEVREMRQSVEDIQAGTSRLIEAVLRETFADKNLQGWENEQSLGEVVEITASLVDPTLPEYRILPHINGERIEEGTGKLLPYNTAEQDGMKSSKYLFQSDDVLYSKIRPYLRKVALVNFKGVCSADMYPLHVINGNLMPEFLKWALLSRHFTKYVIELSRRARMPKVNRSQLFGYRLHYPSKPEQQRLVAHLENIQAETDEARELLEQDVQAVEQLEQSILAAAFRGEV